MQKLLFFPAWPFTAGKQSLVLAAASMFGEGAASRTVSYTHTVRCLGVKSGALSLNETHDCQAPCLQFRLICLRDCASLQRAARTVATPLLPPHPCSPVITASSGLLSWSKSSLLLK